MANLYYCVGTESGNGVIEALIDKGGINKSGFTGNYEHRIYYIRPDNNFIDFIDNEEINAEAFITVIKACYEEVHPIIPRNLTGTYYYVTFGFGRAYAKESTDSDRDLDKGRYNNYNYYINKEHCQKIADNINDFIKNSHDL